MYRTTIRSGTLTLLPQSLTGREAMQMSLVIAPIADELFNV
jgi:hypothetical protein